MDGWLDRWLGRRDGREKALGCRKLSGGEVYPFHFISFHFKYRGSDLYSLERNGTLDGIFF